MGAIFILIIMLIILALMAYFFGPKDFWKKEPLDVLVTRTTIAFTFLLVIFGISISLSEGMLPFPDSYVGMFIIFLFSIPLVIPGFIGYSGGEMLFYIAVVLQMLVLTVILRVMIPIRWVERIKKKFKKVT
jgi:hypothetical protein